MEKLTHFSPGKGGMDFTFRVLPNKKIIKSSVWGYTFWCFLGEGHPPCHSLNLPLILIFIERPQTPVWGNPRRMVSLCMVVPLLIIYWCQFLYFICCFLKLYNNINMHNLHVSTFDSLTFQFVNLKILSKKKESARICFFAISFKKRNSYRDGPFGMGKKARDPVIGIVSIPHPHLWEIWVIIIVCRFELTD